MLTFHLYTLILINLSNHALFQKTYTSRAQGLLTGVAQLIEHRPENQRVTGSIPSQGTCLGCGPGPQ